MKANTTNPPTLEDRLMAYPAAIHTGWGLDGAVVVRLAPTADRADILELHEIADACGHTLAFKGEDDDGTTHWRLTAEVGDV